VTSGEMNSVITSSNDTYRWQPDGLFLMTWVAIVSFELRDRWWKKFKRSLHQIIPHKWILMKNCHSNILTYDFWISDQFVSTFGEVYFVSFWRSGIWCVNPLSFLPITFSECNDFICTTVFNQFSEIVRNFCLMKKC
jgi:hypothetical protein